MVTYTLHNGNTMPALGLGTYRMKTVEELRPVINQAIRSGYRLIDSATVYKNEAAIGSVLKDIFADPSFGIQRQDVFITSKLSPQHQGYEKCYQAVLDSLERFGLDYLDLYLIHWPGTSKTKLSDPVNQQNRMASYRALEQLYKEGKIRHIGVSNYTTAHLQHLLDHCTVIPHIHQFELHPCLYQPSLLQLCNQHQIQIQAYSSLGEGKLIDGTVCIDGLKDIAAAHHTSEPTVLLRWALQHQWAIIPKSTSPQRVQNNAMVWNLNLSSQEMEQLDQVHQSQSYRFCWDPSDIY
ncbi:NADP-dependent oxidoreductase domain-containing protein [Halteromyces radiatus]|uniref:NADP-dependent oxidoreductase domain-containing protein n=1 Tax=Halteromyces radiatus TaxID=101107 RepID=UPI00221E93D8|nr:NADP-dependent oxidoreductase domain-containing protein [Halteromyces radiatus]KAI8092713.1 NADP-dependent oxidoreductase domain-containing protein [Halteromyces radiatus]